MALRYVVYGSERGESKGRWGKGRREGEEVSWEREGEGKGGGEMTDGGLEGEKWRGMDGKYMCYCLISVVTALYP